MKKLTDYLAESQETIDRPRAGDVFEIEIARDEMLISGMISEATDTSITLELDDRGIALLEGYGYSMESVMSEIDADLRSLADSQDPGQLIDALQGDMGPKTAEYLKNMMQEIEQELERQGRGFEHDVYRNLDMLMDRIVAMYSDDVPFDADPEGSDSSHDEYGNPIKHRARHLARRGMRQAQGLKEQDDEGSIPVARAMLNRILMQHPGMLSQYGVEYVMQAVEDFAEELGPQEEIGTSDVSGWVRALQAELKQRMQQGLDEAEYQGRKVALGKPMRGDVKKKKVYVRKPDGKVVKVNFGDPNMKIKKSNPARRRSFRARHNCDNPGPRWKARYWSCRAW